MLTMLLVGAVVFAIVAWLVADPTIKKIATVCFAICALVFVVLLLFQAAEGTLALPG